MADRDEQGHFLPGNRLWEQRTRAGPKPLYEDPDALWADCVEYFEWNEANPLYEDRLVTYMGSAKHEQVAKMRAMTIDGLCLFLGISIVTWREWRKRDDLADVVERVDAIIRTQKFEGAAADLLNANIIARDLGLADRSEFSGLNGGPIKHEVSARERLASKLAGMSAGAGTSGDPDEPDGE